MRKNKRYPLTLALLFVGLFGWAQPQSPAATQPRPDTATPAFFIDGYHGGIYGHIPSWQTRFMVDKLKEYPDWKINLELEPESWDSIAISDPQAYAEFKAGIADSSFRGRVEYINPAYGQSYLYNISGESVIRQFYYGMRKLRQHFPSMVFTTYSSEEPCFTSALPGILYSFGITYASLKNPNTCWGGYTRAHGRQLVGWEGPDGMALLTAPRYAIEALKPHSTWETIASNNSLAYVLGAFKAGILHPVGMCLQDAGWANGPWIKPGEAYKPGAGDDLQDFSHSYHPTIYETWRGYFTTRVPNHADVWRFSQEDLQVSLVWGGQVLQQVAQRVRSAENRIVAAEKLAAMAAVYDDLPWPGASFDEAWRGLLLSQHHDCWIVPYNRLRGTTSTWAEWVGQWTGNSNRRADSIVDRSMGALVSGLAGPAAGPVAAGSAAQGRVSVSVFNTTAVDRDENVEIGLPAGWTEAVITAGDGKPVAGQRIDSGKWLFRVHVPHLGYAIYQLQQTAAQATPGARVTRETERYRIETDLYSVTLDPAKGGVITRLATKGRDPKVFTDDKSLRRFNELRGNFYHEGGFHSSTETPAQVRIIENGPLRVRVQVEGRIAGTPFTQLLTFQQGEPRIDVHLEIGWTADHKIGESPDSIQGYPLKKEFYNDSFKLQALFPVALHGQQIYKNAPFDVLKSGLENTFFDSWDSIKNVVVLNWVDVTDTTGHYGLAVFSDETTSYAHGPHYPLALTVQFSGPGLFGRDYSITGPTAMDYAILPHTGRWDEAGLWTAGTRWNEPLLTKIEASRATEVGQGAQAGQSQSLLDLSASGWEVSAITVSGKDLLVRLFNAEGKPGWQHLYPNFRFDKVHRVGLDGRDKERLVDLPDPQSPNKKYVAIWARRFGMCTLQFKDVLK
jgi:alpha-mannosidase